MLLVGRALEEPEVWRSEAQIAEEVARHERDCAVVAARFAAHPDVLEMLGVAS